MTVFKNCRITTYPSPSPVQRPFSRWTWASQYQNVSILDLLELRITEVVVIIGAIIRAKLPTNQQPTFLQARCPFCDITNSVTALKETEWPQTMLQIQLIILVSAYKQQQLHNLKYLSEVSSGRSISRLQIYLMWITMCWQELHNTLMNQVKSFRPLQYIYYASPNKSPL